MVKELIKEIKNSSISNRFLLSYNKEYTIIAYLICLKYLIETGVYDFYEVLVNEELYDITSEITRLNKFASSKDIKTNINSLILKIKDIPAKLLLMEFIDILDKPIYFHNKEDNIAYVNVDGYLYNYYNPNGNVTYFRKRMSIEKYKVFQIFDDILGIKNNYEIYDKNKIKDYDYIYMYDNSPAYSRNNNILDDIRLFLYNNKNVVLLSNYRKISNFRDGRFIARAIKTIIIDNNLTTILFNIDSNEISIINYDRNKIKDIYRIINNNRKQKDVLLKIHFEDLKENNYRIGFNLYNLDKSSKILDINKIVDENTRYLDNLNYINTRVEREINKLLNK